MKKMIYSKQFLLPLMSGALLVAASAPALAVAELRISDGTNSVTIVDGGAGDLDSAAGSILFNAAPGTFAGWTISLDMGVTKPQIGGANFPQMELNFVAVYNNSAVGSTLTLQFTDTDFTGPTPTSFGATYGGNLAAGASLVYTTYRDNANDPFADGADADGPAGSTVPGAGAPDAGNVITTSQNYTGVQGGTVWTPMLTNSSPYSLTQQIVLTQAAGLGRSNSGDATLMTPDGGSTLCLLGMAMAGLAGIRRKMRFA